MKFQAIHRIVEPPSAPGAPADHDAEKKLQAISDT